jgi:hypothetical protein
MKDACAKWNNLMKTQEEDSHLQGKERPHEKSTLPTLIWDF